MSSINRISIRVVAKERVPVMKRMVILSVCLLAFNASLGLAVAKPSVTPASKPVKPSIDKSIKKKVQKRPAPSLDGAVSLQNR